MTWPYWVLPLLALGGLLWYVLSGNRTVEPIRSSQTATPPSQPLPNISTKTAYLSTAREDWTSIGASPNEYTNQDIYNTGGEKLGTIKDLLIGPDGKGAVAVISGSATRTLPFPSPHSAWRGTATAAGSSSMPRRRMYKRRRLSRGARAQSSDLAEFGGR